jgi:ATP-dependent RNA helicase YTHDC2
MISGDTGSGKTTQVPQFILEHYCDTKQPVRILCTQPRRIAAMSVAERVATERGEPLGGTTGYQIRLENRTSSKTLLTFCTTGILLRTLMYEDSNLEKVTHLIIDEVHERDRFCDFLLGVVRSRLSRFPNLRLILMSAALDVTVFSNYFEKCPMVQVEGKCFPVSEFYLEDILVLTNHLGDVSRLIPAANQLLQAETTKKLREQLNLPPKGSRKQDKIELKDETKSLLDSLIQNSFVDADPTAFDHMKISIRNQLLPVNYRHSQTGLTPLMVAAGESCI